jgi:hypothetical protein
MPKKVKKSGLKPNRNGTYTITSTAGLRDALTEFVDTETEIEVLMEQIKPLQRKAVELKKAATYFADERKIDAIPMDGFYFRLIRRHERFWVGTRADMPKGAPKKAKPLKDIVAGRYVKRGGKKVSLWNFLTRRIPDAEKINDAINEGLISEEELAPAYLERPQAPYLRKYDGELA